MSQGEQMEFQRWAIQLLTQGDSCRRTAIVEASPSCNTHVPCVRNSARVMSLA